MAGVSRKMVGRGGKERRGEKAMEAKEEKTRQEGRARWMASPGWRKERGLMKVRLGERTRRNRNRNGRARREGEK